jgi:hypothetical protein
VPFLLRCLPLNAEDVDARILETICTPLRYHNCTEPHDPIGEIRGSSIPRVHTSGVDVEKMRFLSNKGLYLGF